MDGLVSEIVKRRLSKSSDQSTKFCENLVREALQEAALYSLSKADFFSAVNFNGGTALRLLYKADRFSEDLDFSVKENCKDFLIDSFCDGIEDGFGSLGIKCNPVVKSKPGYAVQRIMIEFPAKETYSDIFNFAKIAAYTQSNAKIRIKLEVDNFFPRHYKSEQKFLMFPMPFAVSVFDAPTLFACKIAAVLGRERTENIKGRDFYDFCFYVRNGVVPNMPCLKSALVFDGILSDGDKFDGKVLKSLLCDKFDGVNYNVARQDVEKFISDSQEVEIWSADFFKTLTTDYLILPDD